jgi:transposase
MKEVISRRRSGHIMNAFYCGLDVHKESTYATVLDSTGQVVAQKRMKNEEIPEFLGPLNVDRVAMEASTYIIPMYRRLAEEGYNLTVSHPKKTRYIAEARIKSDRVDSKALAELLRLDSLPESYIPPRDIAVLREKIRRRAFMVRQRTKLKVKIRDVLAYEGVKPSKEYGLFTGKGVEWLRCLGVEPVDCYLRLMAPLSREVLLLSRELRGLAGEDPDVRLLKTIPGVGYYIALLIKAEVGDISRFTSGDHLASYAGLVPSTRSSGGIERHGRITREGSRWLRWALVEAAMVHLRYDTPVTRLYHRVAERRGRKPALVAAARKLLTVCYSVLRNRRPYFNPLHSQA